jgi:cobalt-zinc-cadmium efflux system membrane fusion protein
MHELLRQSCWPASRIRRLAFCAFLIAGPAVACGKSSDPRADSAERGETQDPGERETPRVRLKSAEAMKTAGIEVVMAQDRPEGAGLVATATIAFDATKRAAVNARAPGIVRAIKADVGAKVDRGATLALIDSTQVGADRSRLGGAQTRVQVAEANYQRESELQTQGISSTKDVLAARQELEAAKSELQSLSASLGAVGGNAGGAGYALTAPLAGAVVRREASLGRLVGTEETLFEVVNTSTMWAEIDVPEDQLIAVAVDETVIVTVDGLGERQFRGTISYISPEIDRRTRTARARAELSNPDGLLRANMFARARIVTGGGKPTVTVPSKSVQRIGDGSVVFVQVGDREFEAREVTLGADDGATVEITSGVRGGEPVVAQGAFLLKSEILKGLLQGDED